MEHKSASVEVKNADRGEVEAIFSTFNVIDSDKDVTLPGAFKDGDEVVISAYGHQSWSGALPVGAGVIKSTDTDARLVGRFFMDTTAGRDTFNVVKQLGALGEWSYGFDVLDSEQGQKDGQQVRFLKALKPYEVSPVLRGAGIGVTTVSAKAASEDVTVPTARKTAIASHETSVVKRSWDASAIVAAIPADATPSQLRSVFAWVDSSGDTESKSSYRYPHHQGVGGPANVRACLAGIAALNGARGGTTIPAGDVKGVYNHLAAHLRDADMEPPELRSGPVGALKFYDEGTEVLAAVSGFISRATEVMALRARKGKGLASASADLISWINDDLARLKALLENPQLAAEEPLADDEISTLLAAIGHMHRL